MWIVNRFPMRVLCWHAGRIVQKTVRRTGKERKHNSHLTNWCFPIHKQNITAIRSRRAQINRSIRIVFYFILFFSSIWLCATRSTIRSGEALVLALLCAPDRQWTMWGKTVVALQNKWNHSKRKCTFSYVDFIRLRSGVRIETNATKIAETHTRKSKRNWMNEAKAERKTWILFVLGLQRGVWLLTHDSWRQSFSWGQFFFWSFFLLRCCAHIIMIAWCNRRANVKTLPGTSPSTSISYDQ